MFQTNHAFTFRLFSSSSFFLSFFPALFIIRRTWIYDHFSHSCYSPSSLFYFLFFKQTNTLGYSSKLFKIWRKQKKTINRTDRYMHIRNETGWNKTMLDGQNHQHSLLHLLQACCLYANSDSIGLVSNIYVLLFSTTGAFMWCDRWYLMHAES